MTKDEAVLIIKQSANDSDMDAKLELQRRHQILELIDKGYFDPILGSVSAASDQRVERLSSAAHALVSHFAQKKEGSA